MNTLSLLKNLAAGFVPLLAYIAADLVFGETIGLFVGLAIGILEFVITFIKERKADVFIAADTFLLAAMGLLSLLLRNRLFFRLKPSIMEGFMAIAMAVLLFLPKETLKSYMSHQIKGIVLDDSGMPALRHSLTLMVSVLVLHAGLTVWAALAASTALWGFVSGGLLYIMLGIALLSQWMAARGQRKNIPTPKPFPWCLLLFDEKGRLYAGKTPAVDGGWDSPARGEAAGEAGLQAGLGQTLSRLGIGVQAAAAGHSFPIRPAFIADAAGRIKMTPGSGSSPELSDYLLALGPGDEFVLVATLPSAAFPKGIDPTALRLMSIPDLLALASAGRLAPAFARELLALSSARHPLRGDAGASIVSDTNDARI
ncbi:MAG TPA: septation protein IspZ [Rectinemataceae bacterium]|nr:septation protein IspZ [Rectinemataceae bacterium]